MEGEWEERDPAGTKDSTGGGKIIILCLSRVVKGEWDPHNINGSRKRGQEQHPVIRLNQTGGTLEGDEVMTACIKQRSTCRSHLVRGEIQIATEKQIPAKSGINSEVLSVVRRGE